MAYYFYCKFLYVRTINVLSSVIFIKFIDVDLGDNFFFVCFSLNQKNNVQNVAYTFESRSVNIIETKLYFI